MSRMILLADDSVTIQKVIELTFMDEDYEVVAVGNGDDALEKLDDTTPDFVIVDVHMPGASGYDVAKHSKSLRPEVPVLLLVGTFEPFDEELAEKSGCDAFLKKPFDSQELQRLVEELSAEAEREGGPLEATGWQAQSPGAASETTTESAPAEAAPAADEPTASEPEEAAPFSIGLEDDEEPPATRVEPPPELPPEAPPEPAPESVGSTASPEATTEAPPEAGSPETGATQAEPPVFGEVPERLAARDDEEPTPAMPTEPEAVESTSTEPASEAVGVTSPLSDDDVDRIARRIVELLGDRAIRDVAWEVVPDMAEVVIRTRLHDLESQVETVE